MKVCYIVERFPIASTRSVLNVEDSETISQIEAHFQAALQSINRVRDDHSRTLTLRHSGDAQQVAESVYRVLTSRPFSGYSRGASESLRPAAVKTMAGFIYNQQPIHFYYDIGGGYSAALSRETLGVRDGSTGLSFEPNALHLLCLAQIAQFAECVRHIYPPGLKMHLVIDNLVAQIVNDIPLTKTLHFCELLRGLIGQLGMDARCSLLIESQHSSLSSSDVPRLAELPPDSLDPWQYENVLRFSGKWLSQDEAGRRQRLYTEVVKLSEKHLEASIDGVHLTQRLGASTLPFRAFRGGNARIQAGRLGFIRNANREMVPRLLTSANVEDYELRFVPISPRSNICPPSDVDSGRQSFFPAMT